jgi:MFS family permease
VTELGLRANAAQFSLLVGLNAVVGALVGLERTVLPLVGEDDFGLSSKSAILSFIVAFGLAKAFANLLAGRLADEQGRRRILLAGWALALPVAPLIAFAPSWGWIVVANLFLGANQGLAWSMTVLMKIDLAGPARRGFALGLNESAGYVGVAATALATGALAATFAPRTVVWTGAACLCGLGLALSLLFVRDTSAHVRREQADRGPAVANRPVVAACSQAGFFNNLNDALAWGLAPLYLAAHGASLDQIGAVAAVYPAIWGFGQLGAGWLSDIVGRKPLVVLGMLVQAGALALLAASGGEFAPALVAAALLGVGTALVYPTLIAAVSDAVDARGRARAVALYRFWRDAGFVAGGLAVGLGADALGFGPTIVAVAALTGASGLVAWLVPWSRRRRSAEMLLADARRRIARLEPREAQAALERGALLVDVRSPEERLQAGVVPGSLHIPLSVLEWRLDPDSPVRNPAIGGLQHELVIFCAQGFSSSLAAARVRQLGFPRVGDIVGGFEAWKAAGLPVRNGSALPARPGELPGSGPVEPPGEEPTIVPGDYRHR